jgi:hypothetical protein
MRLGPMPPLILNARKWPRGVNDDPVARRRQDRLTSAASGMGNRCPTESTVEGGGDHQQMQSCRQR